MSLEERIVSAVADREGVDPLDLETPLNEAVDTGVLEALDRGTGDRQDGPYPLVEFVYYGYTVGIDGTGNVTITERTGATDEGSMKTSDHSLESLSAEMDRQEDALKKVTDVIAARERPFEERLDGLLEVVRETLGVDSATLSYVDNDSYVFEAVDVTASVDLQAGEIVPLEDTVCKRAVETEKALVLRDVEVDAPELANSAFEVSSYIGVPVFVDGEVYGTFCFYDTEARDEEFSDRDLTIVELLSKWVCSELEQRHRERSLQASTTERPSERC